MQLSMWLWEMRICLHCWIKQCAEGKPMMQYLSNPMSQGYDSISNCSLMACFMLYDILIPIWIKNAGYYAYKLQFFLCSQNKHNIIKSLSQGLHARAQTTKSLPTNDERLRIQITTMRDSGFKLQRWRKASTAEGSWPGRTSRTSPTPYWIVCAEGRAHLKDTKLNSFNIKL